MVENTSDFKENVKNAFSKVKEEILELRNYLKENNELLLEISKRLTFLEEKKAQIMFDNIKEDKNKSISNGNHGDLSNKQQQAAALSNTQQHIILNENNQNQDFKELKVKFKRLTDRELSVFMTIYELEEESGFGGVSYKDIAKRLNLSESAIRAYLMYLFNKEMPIGKKKLLNGKSQFFIKSWFRTLNLPKDLLKPKNSTKK